MIFIILDRPLSPKNQRLAKSPKAIKATALAGLVVQDVPKWGYRLNIINATSIHAFSPNEIYHPLKWISEGKYWNIWYIPSYKQILNVHSLPEDPWDERYIYLDSAPEKGQICKRKTSLLTIILQETFQFPGGTWRIIPWLGYVVNNYGDHKSPKDPVMGPLPNGCFMASNWVANALTKWYDIQDGHLLVIKTINGVLWGRIFNWPKINGQL